MTLPTVRFQAFDTAASTLGLQLFDASGTTAEDLTGRTFRWALVSGRGATAATVTATVADVNGVSTATMVHGATSNAALLSGKGAAEDYTLSVYELTEAGQVPILAGVYLLRRGPDPDAGDDPGDDASAGPVYQVLGGGPLVRVTQTGAPGRSAAQQYYDAGLIDAPTVTALNTYLQGAFAAGDAAALASARTYADTGDAAEAAARTAAITAAVNGLLNGAGGAFDTLKELADLLLADEGTAATLATLVATKAATTYVNTQDAATLASANAHADAGDAAEVTARTAAITAAAAGATPASTVFNADGSITTTRAGQAVTTTFNADGTITRSFNPAISAPITTTINADGSITEA